MHTYRIRAVIRLGSVGYCVTYRRKIYADNPAAAMAALYTWVRTMGGDIEEILSIRIRRGRR